MGKAGRPSKGMTLSKHNIELAIKSTQSMGQAALYMNVSKNTFKKYAKIHGLYKPITRLEENLGGKKSKPIQRRHTIEKRYTRRIFEMCV